MDNSALRFYSTFMLIYHGIACNVTDNRCGAQFGFVVHEKSEKLFPLHKHSKGQLSYVEGGLAYVVVDNQSFVVPPRHFLWVPKGLLHMVKVSFSATVVRSLYFYSRNDENDSFYSKLGIYPASELLIQMIASIRNVGMDNMSIERMQIVNFSLLLKICFLNFSNVAFK